MIFTFMYEGVKVAHKIDLDSNGQVTVEFFIPGENRRSKSVVRKSAKIGWYKRLKWFKK